MPAWKIKVRAASARWRGDPTPSARRCPRDRVGSMALRFYAIDVTASARWRGGHEVSRNNLTHYVHPGHGRRPRRQDGTKEPRFHGRARRRPRRVPDPSPRNQWGRSPRSSASTSPMFSTQQTHFAPAADPEKDPVAALGLLASTPLLDRRAQPSPPPRYRSLSKPNSPQKEKTDQWEGV